MNSRTRIFLVAFLVFASVTHAQLSATFYDTKCPRLKTIVRRAMRRAVKKEPRVAASMLRLFFHDCFVQGCDASILLDDTSTFKGEKNAGPNRHSVRSFKVVDIIKKRLEATCNGTVSCADILALAARDGVKLLRGPTWIVPLGRRDSRTANQTAANSQLPGSGSSLATLISMFSAKGLNAREMVALSGGHTIGKAKCSSFRDHIYNDSNINAAFAKARKANCPNTTDGTGDTILAPLDKRTPNRFDNRYYKNLVARRGLLHSDQELFNNGSQDYVVRAYVKSKALFRREFVAAMIKMGNISPLTGTNGEIRRNCRRLN